MGCAFLEQDLERALVAARREAQALSQPLVCIALIGRAVDGIEIDDSGLERLTQPLQHDHLGALFDHFQHPLQQKLADGGRFGFYSRGSKIQKPTKSK